MKNNYCLPIIKSTRAEVLAKINKNTDEYSYFEVWLDYIKDIDEIFIDELIDKYSTKLVFVFRSKNLEEPKMSAEDQVQFAKLLSGKGCLVDFDVYDQKDLIKLTKDLTLNRIVSFHNYTETPPDNEISQIINDIKACNPKIIKLATFCNDKSDALRLLKLMLEMNASEQKHIILGMGEIGLITRIYGVMWGNELTFIPETEDEKSAPGQVTKAEFEALFDKLSEVKTER